jgi:hypothetical protein
MAESNPRPIRGNCFQYAGKRMLAEPDDTTALVVHGIYEAFPGHRDVHGWFEKDGVAWDWQTHGCTPKGRSRFKVTKNTPPAVPIPEFYETRKIEVRKMFTRDETIKAIGVGHWGPWFGEGEDS